MDDSWDDLPQEEKDAYNRATNTERFRPLHDFALALIDQLEREYEVERLEGYGEILPDYADAFVFDRPNVRLTPSDLDSLPLTFFFTNFPGVFVQAGQLTGNGYPPCGCDACAEDVEEESVNLREAVEEWVTGSWHDVIDIPKLGRASRSIENRFAGGGMSGTDWQLSREEALKLVDEIGGTSREWKPWPRR